MAKQILVDEQLWKWINSRAIQGELLGVTLGRLLETTDSDKANKREIAANKRLAEANKKLDDAKKLLDDADPLKKLRDDANRLRNIENHYVWRIEKGYKEQRYREISLPRYFYTMFILECLEKSDTAMATGDVL